MAPPSRAVLPWVMASPRRSDSSGAPRWLWQAGFAAAVLLTCAALLGLTQVLCSGLPWSEPPAPKATPFLPLRSAAETAGPASSPLGTGASGMFAWTPDGQALITARGGTVQRMAASPSGVPGPAWSPAGAAILGLSLDAGGTTLLTRSDQFFELWDLRTHQKRFTLAPHKEGVTSAAISPDGARVAAGDERGQVGLWDVRTGRLLLAFTAHPGAVAALAFSPNSEVLVSVADDLRGQQYEVGVWNTSTGRREHFWRDRVDLDVGHFPALFLTPDASRVLATWTVEGRLESSDEADWKGRAGLALRDARTGTQVWQVELPTLLHGIAFSPQGDLLAAETLDGLFLLSGGAGQSLRRLSPETFGPSPLAFSPDGRRLAVAQEGAEVQVWDLAPGAR